MRPLRPAVTWQGIMPKIELSNNEIKIIKECLTASAYGPFFIDNNAKSDPFWEIHSLFGLKMEKLRKIADNFPQVDLDDQDVRLAINNSICNLIGYPHNRFGETWFKYLSVTEEELNSLLKKWRNEKAENYFEGLI
jgi:hypothetical protein